MRGKRERAWTIPNCPSGYGIDDTCSSQALPAGSLVTQTARAQKSGRFFRNLGDGRKFCSTKRDRGKKKSQKVGLLLWPANV